MLISQQISFNFPRLHDIKNSHYSARISLKLGVDSIFLVTFTACLMYVVGNPQMHNMSHSHTFQMSQEY